MVHEFDEEAFMREPVEIEVRQEMQEPPVHDYAVGLLAPMEQSIFIHVGGQDYDVRDLVYRLLRAEQDLQILRADFEGITAELLARVSHLEEDAWMLKGRL